MGTKVFGSRRAAEIARAAITRSACSTKTLRVGCDSSPTGEAGWVVEVEDWSCSGALLWLTESGKLGLWEAH